MRVLWKIVNFVGKTDYAMIRILTSVFSVVVLVLSIRAFVKAMKGEELADRVASFFLLIIASVLFVIVVFDTYSTWGLLYRVVIGMLAIDAPAIFPGTAPMYGIWEHPLLYLYTLDGFCALTFAVVLLRKRIPSLLARGNRIVGLK